MTRESKFDTCEGDAQEGLEGKGKGGGEEVVEDQKGGEEKKRKRNPEKN